MSRVSETEESMMQRVNCTSRKKKVNKYSERFQSSRKLRSKETQDR